MRGVRGVEVTDEGGASTALETLDTEAKRPGEEVRLGWALWEPFAVPLPHPL